VTATRKKRDPKKRRVMPGRKRRKRRLESSMSSNSCSLISDNRQATSDMPMAWFEAKLACPTELSNRAIMLNG
jgi:hypothetical protein